MWAVPCLLRQTEFRLLTVTYRSCLVLVTLAARSRCKWCGCIEEQWRSDYPHGDSSGPVVVSTGKSATGASAGGGVHMSAGSPTGGAVWAPAHPAAAVGVLPRRSGSISLSTGVAVSGQSEGVPLSTGDNSGGSTGALKLSVAGLVRVMVPTCRWRILGKGWWCRCQRLWVVVQRFGYGEGQ